MQNHKHKVLLDLSLGLLGYSGIPHDTRLMYKMLSENSHMETYGIIYNTFKGTALSSLGKRDKMMKQALFMSNLTEQDCKFSDLKIIKILQKSNDFYKTFLKKKVVTQELNTKFYWSFIWRNIFRKSLSPDDIDLLIKKGRFLLGDTNNRMIFSRILFNMLPKVKMNTRDYDFVIFQGPEPKPIKVSPTTTKIVRYHDFIPVINPDFVNNTKMNIELHIKSIKHCIKDSFFVCNSEATREDLLEAFPSIEKNSSTIPCALSDSFFPEHNTKSLALVIQKRLSSFHESVIVRESKEQSFIASRELKKIYEKMLNGESIKYILTTSSLEPKKNHRALIRSFERLKANRTNEEFYLVIVGSPGWKFEPILKAMKPLIKLGYLIHLENIPPNELRLLYSHASVYAFPSFYEGFGFSPMEAMMCDTPSVVSDIKAHEWVMGDAVLYCNPYMTESLTEQIERLMFSENSNALRAELLKKGRVRRSLYSLEKVSGMWLELFENLKGRCKIR